MTTGISSEKNLTKPPWLNKRIRLSECDAVDSLLKEYRLNTVCRQAACPNRGECFGMRQATFLILGKNCSRSCAFCNVEHSRPETVDNDEPRRVAEAVRRLQLSHVVITGVTRDDLPDGGARHFSETVGCVRQAAPAAKIEVLVPDFCADEKAIQTVVESEPDIIAHNLETVPRLYREIRPQAEYVRSLRVLKMFKSYAPAIYTKSGIMLGLGEARREVEAVFGDAVAAGVDFFSIGQYLAPSARHAPVKEYIAPEEFETYNQKALAAGFKSVACGPYVRSSYQAHRYLLAG